MKKTLLSLAFMLSASLACAKSISIELKTEIYDDVINSWCSSNGYEEKLLDKDGQEIDNPESKEDFFKKTIRQFLYRNLAVYEGSQAAESARRSKIDEINDKTK